jgi:hypothetical protein
MRYPRMSPIMAQMGVHSSVPSSSIFGGVKEEQKEHNKAAASDEVDQDDEEEDAELDAAEDEAEATAVVQRTTLALASVNRGRRRNLIGRFDCSLQEQLASSMVRSAGHPPSSSRWNPF